MLTVCSPAAVSYTHLSFALGRSLRSRTLGAPGFHGLTGGVDKARERIHRAMADARLLANPASWGRVADPLSLIHICMADA